MDRVNAILWLKCRLTMRGHQTSAATTVGTVLLLLMTFASLMPAALVLASFLTALPAEPAGELTHIMLGMMYAVWIGFPVMGFKINEFFDVTRMLHFPVPPVELFAAGMLSSFVDVSSFILYPFLLAVLAGTCDSLWQVVPAALVLLTFVMHTFAMGQLVLFSLVHVLNHRRVSELLLILIPLVLFLSVCGLELTYLVRWPAALMLHDLMPPSTFIGFLPPGVAANALIALRAGAYAKAAYHMVLLAALTGLTVVAGGWLTERLLRQAGPLDALANWVGRVWPARASRGAATARPGRVARLAAHVLGGPQLQALAAKELRLLVREPQVRMALGFYVATTLLLISAGFSGAAGDQSPVVLPLMSFSAVFILAGVLLNSLALEREGLRFLLAAPVAPAVVLVGNNLAQWFLVTSVSAGCLAAVAIAFRISWTLCAAHLYMAQTVLVLLLGFGNLSSVLVPYRLPAKGVHPKAASGSGHSFLVLVLGSLASGLSMGLAALSVAVLLLPPFRVDAALVALNLPLSLSGVLGVWAVCTALAAWILHHRREPLLREVVD